MEYFKSGAQLILRLEGSDKYIVKNHIGSRIKEYPKEVFEAMPKKKMMKTQFFEELNNYFRNYKETWEDEGEKFRAMENFEVNKDGECTNYILDSLPKWYKIIKRGGDEITLIFVYNKGKVYYLNLDKLDKGISQLHDARTFEPLTFVRLRNCCPVMNLTKKGIK